MFFINKLLFIHFFKKLLYLSMGELKELMNYGKDEWSLPGYKVVKTKHYITKSLHFSPTKRDTSLSLKSIEKYPDPAKYSETFQQSFNKY